MAEARALAEAKGLTFVCIAVSNLENDGAMQLVLPVDGQSNGELDAAVDLVQDRFGSGSLTRAGLLGRDQGLSVPLLPD